MKLEASSTNFWQKCVAKTHPILSQLSHKTAGSIWRFFVCHFIITDLPITLHGGFTLFILSTLYIIITLWLAVYAFNNWVLTALYWRKRHNTPQPARHIESWPRVTVQLPIFNEAEVIERLITAITQLNYPADRLEIQVLDDSTDRTAHLAQTLVDRARQAGHTITYLHRTDRSGFKAGALKAGLTQASGEFIIIFDADFVPPSDYLRQTIPYFLNRPQLGFLQTRWGHLNPHYSLLTGAQSVALDGHFGVEQVARNRNGLLMNFNGTGGVWRRAAIDGAGGWHGDTICEDLDLSYRAQLNGWQSLYLRDVVAPAELPPQLAAYKRQQFRWAKGSIQCLKKLWRDVLTAQRSAWVKLQAFIYLSGYLIHPLMIVLLLASLPLLLQAQRVDFSLAWLTVLSLAPPTMFSVAMFSLHGLKGGLRQQRYLPFLILLGSGVALSNTKAVIEAFLGVDNSFRRTPKFKVERKSDQWQQSDYKLLADKLILGEIALCIYALLTIGVVLWQGNYFAVPFMCLYALSFGYVSGLGLWETRHNFGLWLKSLVRTGSVDRRPLTADGGES